MVGLNINDRNNDEVFDSDVVIRDNRIQSTTRTRIRLDRETGSIFTHNNDGDITFQWDMPGNNLFFGGHVKMGIWLFSLVISIAFRIFLGQLFTSMVNKPLLG